MHVHFRFWQRYTPSEGDDVSLKEIVDDFILSGEKENLLAENKLGHLIRRIFPGVEKPERLSKIIV